MGEVANTPVQLTTGAREYRSTNAAMLKLESATLNDLYKTSTDANRWEAVQLWERTVGYRNKCFGLSSTLACGIASQHHRVRSKFPSHGFLWFGLQCGLQTEYDSHTCKAVLGSWFQQLCAFWVENGGLDTRDCRTDFTVMSVQVQEDMVKSSVATPA